MASTISAGTTSATALNMSGDTSGLFSFVPANGLTSFTGTGYSPTITLTDAATIAWSTTTGQVATFTFVSSNRTMGAPTGLVNGGFYSLCVIQNAGSNTLTWNSIFKWANGAAPVLSTAASAKDNMTNNLSGNR